jgi:hypothetical protein
MARMANEKAPISTVRDSKRRLRLMMAKEGDDGGDTPRHSFLEGEGLWPRSAFFPPDRLMFTFLQCRFNVFAVLRNKSCKTFSKLAYKGQTQA